MRKWLITGGAGFIGSNTVERLLQQGENVIVLDNLSRKGTDKNLEYLKSVGDFKFLKVDIRDFEALKESIANEDFDVVLHLAAQVAVTTSVENPRKDFEINALGTFNVLEAIRLLGKNPVIINASTNKVYGGMKDVKLKLTDDGYKYVDYPRGIDESFPLDFHSPYGCSKGAADQYIRDYSRIYGLKTFTLRQSCIYGLRQFGIEDQGWVAWFAIAMALGKAITIYGDGKQVRDILFVDDLVDLYLMIAENAANLKESVYNVGGGHKQATSIMSVLEMISKIFGKNVPDRFEDWRPGDQKVYISNVDRLKKELGWEPKVGIEEGLSKLIDWIEKNKKEVEEVF